MTRTVFAVAFIAASAFTATAYAGDDAYPNGSKKIPDSSTAATPSSVKQSPGTVGAMKDAGDGSFTASKKAQKEEHGN